MLRRLMIASSSSTIDPYWANVVSLLHFDGPAGSTTFTDEKGRAWSAFGNAQIDTAHSKFGGASGLFDGAGDYLQTASTSNLEANADFTLEVQVSRGDSGRIMAIAQKRPAGAGNAAGYILYVTATNTIGLTAWNTSAGILVNLSGSTSLALGSFHHAAATKQGSTWRIFLDGVLEGTATESGTYRSSSQPLLIGRDSTTNARDFKGNLDEFRITKGVARYTTNFTPPTAAFPNG